MNTTASRSRPRRLLMALLLALAGLPAAAQPQTAPPEAEDPGRTVPPLRLSVSAVYQRWMQDEQRLRAVSIPVTAEMRLRPSLGLRLGISRAAAEGSGFEPVEGVTDLHLGLDYLIRFERARLVFDLGVDVPTGTSRLSEAAYATAFQLGLSQYDFRVPHFGRGLAVAPGVALVAALSDAVAITLGAAYRYHGAFDPVSDLPDAYDWGNEMRFTVGGAWQVGRTLRLTADGTLTRYDADAIGDVTVYEAGQRITAQAQIRKTLPRHDLQIGLRYRTVGTGRALAPGGLQPEPAPARAGLFGAAAQYGVRLGPALRATLAVDGTRYEPDALFDRITVYGIRLAPALTPAPRLTIPVHARYAFGDLDGLEAGLGLVAIL
ncbi:MAG: hypothetical protein R3247_05875 [Rhodothermales bacterium]|nr:hypothetical protein [Rhodothermales bacterium]